MRILINFTVLHSGGGIQVAHSLVNELIAQKFPHDFCIIATLNLYRQIEKYQYPENFKLCLIEYTPSSIKHGKKARIQIKKVVSTFKPTIVFTLFGPSYWKPEIPHLCGFALPHFIYPESPFFKLISFKERIKWKLLGFLKFISFKRDCDYYVTETEDASNRLSAKVGGTRDRVFTVNNAYNGIFNSRNRWIDTSKKTVCATGFKLITITAYYPHKNLNVIPDTINYLNVHYPHFDFTFVLSVNEDRFPGLTEQQKKHVLFLGKVSIEECPSLYQQSDALFMPTLLECFTVSYLEAMKMGKPILTSDLPFAYDICQDAAVYFQPLDPKDIGEKIVALAQNNRLQEELIHKGNIRLRDFGNAADRARSYLEILENIVTQKAVQ